KIKPAALLWGGSSAAGNMRKDQPSEISVTTDDLQRLYILHTEQFRQVHMFAHQIVPGRQHQLPPLPFESPPRSGPASNQFDIRPENREQRAADFPLNQSALLFGYSTSAVFLPLNDVSRCDGAGIEEGLFTGEIQAFFFPENKMTG